MRHPTADFLNLYKAAAELNEDIGEHAFPPKLGDVTEAVKLDRQRSFDDLLKLMCVGKRGAKGKPLKR